MRTARVAAVGLLAAAVLAFVGCDSGPKTGEVSGTASFDGTPIEDGAIDFEAADGKSPTAGGTIKDGKYAVDKVPVGTAKVRIRGSKVIGTKQVYPGQANSPTRP